MTHFEKIVHSAVVLGPFEKNILFSMCVHISKCCFYQTFVKHLEDIKLFFLNIEQGSLFTSNFTISWPFYWHNASLVEGDSCLFV